MTRSVDRINWIKVGECSPSIGDELGIYNLLYDPKKEKTRIAVKFFLESNEKDYNKNCSFRLQGRENIES